MRIRDWSSDVCSSDLDDERGRQRADDLRVGEGSMRSGYIKLGVMLDGIGGSHWGWRRQHIDPTASIDINAYIAEATRAEEAKIDFIFIAATVSITAKSSPHFLNRLQPNPLSRSEERRVGQEGVRPYK